MSELRRRPVKKKGKAARAFNRDVKTVKAVNVVLPATRGGFRL